MPAGAASRVIDGRNWPYQGACRASLAEAWSALRALLGKRSVPTLGQFKTPRQRSGSTPAPRFWPVSAHRGRRLQSHSGCRGSAPTLARSVRVPECQNAAVSPRYRQPRSNETRSRISNRDGTPTRGHAKHLFLFNCGGRPRVRHMRRVRPALRCHSGLEPLVSGLNLQRSHRHARAHVRFAPKAGYPVTLRKTTFVGPNWMPGSSPGMTNSGKCGSASR